MSPIKILLQCQPFESIFEIYAEKSNVPIKCISFETVDGTQIYPSDTLEKLNITIADIVGKFKFC
jgi:hypothetical protein